MPTPTTRLLVMRHADAVPQAPGTPDAHRALTDAGRRRAATRRDAVLAAAPDVVLCSSATRATQTLEALGPLDADVTVDDGIYTATPTALLLRLGELGDDVGCALLIGHLPTVQQLVQGLLHRDAPDVGFRPASLAILGMDQRWADLAPQAATLLDHIR